MNNVNKTNESWLPLSRGLVKHLKGMSGNSVKVFIYILIRAGFRGEMKGKMAISFSDLAMELGMHYMTAYRAVKELEPKYLTYVPARNRHEITVFTVQKYKVVSDFLADSSASSSEREELPPFAHKEGKRKRGTVEGAQTVAPESPNKLKNREEELIDLLSEYTNSEVIEKFMDLFVEIEKREYEEPTVADKIFILKDLKTFIQEYSKESEGDSESILYAAIERMMKPELKRNLFFDPHIPAKWQDYLKQVMDGIEDEYPIQKTVEDFKEFIPDD